MKSKISNPLMILQLVNSLAIATCFAYPESVINYFSIETFLLQILDKAERGKVYYI